MYNYVTFLINPKETLIKRSNYTKNEFVCLCACKMDFLKKKTEHISNVMVVN